MKKKNPKSHSFPWQEIAQYQKLVQIIQVRQNNSRCDQQQEAQITEILKKKT